MIRLYFTYQRLFALLHNKVQCGVTKDGEPEEGEQSRYCQHPEYELTNSTATADLRNKEAHKRRPGNRPGKDEQRPVTNPVAVRIGLHIEGAFNNTTQIRPGVLQQGIKNMNTWPHSEDNGHQKNSQSHVQHRQVLNPLIHTCDHRRRRCQSNHSNGDHLHSRAYRNRRPQVINTCIDLRNG